MINSQKPVLSTPKIVRNQLLNVTQSFLWRWTLIIAVVPIIIVVVMFAKKKTPQKPMDICHQDI